MANLCNRPSENGVKKTTYLSIEALGAAVKKEFLFDCVPFKRSRAFGELVEPARRSAFTQSRVFVYFFR